MGGLWFSWKVIKEYGWLCSFALEYALVYICLPTYDQSLKFLPVVLTLTACWEDFSLKKVDWGWGFLGGGWVGGGVNFCLGNMFGLSGVQQAFMFSKYLCICYFRKTRQEWSDFLNRSPERYNIKLPELPDSKGTSHHQLNLVWV